jgi:hypothetical protein
MCKSPGGREGESGGGGDKGGADMDGGGRGKEGRERRGRVKDISMRMYYTSKPTYVCPH